ncbi:2-oxo-4-hydroxy-4-carboxy-5-ureidoimidazoline decarboxylase [Salipiger sp. 1_MG-2023]|uniref:2-oxo-4-hydroxy-4-carboxy-5-ureidoimidazoline decarboxylase n=1 Tax=Salipiger sp. 1_MG-2023 TaxID=3062665 RepID=UPI0026E38D2B|nr:2-oxo-4-hydroxy-4-carboxy-5-ureidoimidazoline decarboxylase [Salipiger sp. 1_MG-2023]MDO6587198.1 2-oxo-4-hydroxy-4-carboxy-5-ureidoimidazoline decarboxylase [Salipiger sp. 1_MG-2023]
MTHPLDILNHAHRDDALALLAPLVERSAWVAQDSLSARPFADDAAVAQALVETILLSGAERRLAMFRVHPELAGREALAGDMTPASTGEQARLGLMSLDRRDAQRLTRLNAAYGARFGHPFIIALHRVPDLATLFDLFERRVTASPIEEHVSTLAEIASVIRARAAAAFAPLPHHRPQEHAQ